MKFLPKCRTSSVLKEKGHGTGRKGMAPEEKGVARHHAKTGWGKHQVILLDVLKTGVGMSYTLKPLPQLKIGRSQPVIEAFSPESPPRLNPGFSYWQILMC